MGCLSRPVPARPRLLDRVRHAIRMRHYSPRTERAYVGWIKRYIFFYDAKRHPDTMGAPEVISFLSHLALSERVSASTQNQDVRTIQELLGHRDVSTTMIYTHVLNRGRNAVLSPLDAAP